MRIDTLICGRENDLLGFLYGELSESETNAFESHLKECDTCNTELAAFGTVRESIVAWRNESLGSIGFPAQIADPSPTLAERKKPSAVAALREFFNLSPLWMKGAVAFAAILFFVFAGLSLARLRDKPAPVVVVTPAATTSSPQELQALVEQRVQEELRRIRNSNEGLSNSKVAQNDSSPKGPVKRIANRSTEVALSTSSQKARRPLSKSEREQLAADLRLISANDNDLELLDDRINQ